MTSQPDISDESVEIIERWIAGGYTEYSGDNGENWFTKKQWNHINQAMLQARIDPFNFVEPCEPDCSPERHAYHKGQWDMALRIEATLTSQLDVKPTTSPLNKPLEDVKREDQSK